MSRTDWEFLPVYFTGDDSDMTDADSPTARVVYLARAEDAT